MCQCQCQTPDTADQFTSQPVATRRATLLITHSSLPLLQTCRDERWTYMYKVDCAAAAFHLGYTVRVVCISLITHHGQLLILWLDVAPSEMGANTKRVITEFALY